MVLLALGTALFVLVRRRASRWRGGQPGQVTEPTDFVELPAAPAVQFSTELTQRADSFQTPPGGDSVQGLVPKEQVVVV